MAFTDFNLFPRNVEALYKSWYNISLQLNTPKWDNTSTSTLQKMKK